MKQTVRTGDPWPSIVVWDACCTVTHIAEKVSTAGLTRQALIIVGETLSARHRGVKEKSKLYDAGFAHGFRLTK